MSGDDTRDAPPPKGDPGRTEATPEVLEELSELFGPDEDVILIDDVADASVTEVVTVSSPTAGTSGATQGTEQSETDEPTADASGASGRVVAFPPGGRVDPPADPAAGRDPLIVIDEDIDPPADRDIDPRFEERRRAWARRDRLKRVRWVKIALILAAASVVVLGVMASPIFAVRTFVMEGNVYTSADSVDEVRGILKGSSIFTADTTRARRVLLEDPWVADVRITTHFPSRVVVEVSERVPVVWYVGGDGKARMVDARGRVIAVLAGWPTKYLQVKGTGPDVAAGSSADDAYRAAAQLVLALPDELRPKVTALDLSPAGELSMVLKGDTLVRFGTPTGLQDKLVAVVVLLRRQDPRTIAVIDVSAGEPTVLGR
ncbi:MAG: cell division protein FtsQ/DivIB [Ilumatobacteraceae bacterium]